jgi:excinuclease ABC subunit C
MDAALRRKLDDLPAEPGCYLMKDRAGEVVYVGKAASLRSRVRQYFDASRTDDRIFIPLLDELLGDIQTIVTRSEKEAVLLENELIKKHRPRFNVRLRDDKDFIVLRLDVRHPFPRLEVRRAREGRREGARYFGPYASASSIRETLRIVNRHFGLRTCTDHVFDHRKRPCILFQIQRCPAPCVYEIPREEYGASVEDAVAFLEGRETELVERLRGRMNEAAEGLRYEQAARLRDQVVAVERSLEKQRVLMADRTDRDVIGLYREGPDLVLQLLRMRGGKLQESRSHPVKENEFPDADILSSFLALLYEGEPAPDEILVPVEPTALDGLADVLSEGRDRRVRILTPQRGAKADLLEVAARNAEQGFKDWHEKDERREQALVSLCRALHLARPPRWMECYDISTFQGALAVGSGVSFKEGEPDKANYRRYKVKAVAGQDDFAMLYEVITRRLRRAVAEGSFPDLLVIDGGKGQLNAALAAARDLGVPTRPSPGNEGAPFVELVGLAKSRLIDAASLGTTRVVRGRGRLSRSGPGAAQSGVGIRRASLGGEGAMPPEVQLVDSVEVKERGFVPEAARTPERVFLPGRKDPVVLRQNSAELFVLARLRDEAHRFAITFHRKLHRERNFQSVLEEISGIGEGRKKALLRHFGSLKKVKEASLEELAQVEGFGQRQAALVHDFFRRSDLSDAAAEPSAGAPPASGTQPGSEVPSASGDPSAFEEQLDAALAEEAGEGGVGSP